jgi:Uma2 family endonuclease
MLYHGVMTAPATACMTVRDFLAWAEAQKSGRHEFFRGRIVSMMAPERAEHAEVKFRVTSAFDLAIRRKGLRCQAFVDGLAVEIDETTSYVPDALVNCGDKVPRASLTAPNPVIVVEVLSPSTEGLDKAGKLADYFRVPSIAHYLIIDLTREHVIHHQRQQESVARVAIVKSGELLLDPPGLSISVAELFG